MGPENACSLTDLRMTNLSEVEIDFQSDPTTNIEISEIGLRTNACKMNWLSEFSVLNI